MYFCCRKSSRFLYLEGKKKFRFQNGASLASPEGSFLNGLLRLREKFGAYEKIGAFFDLAHSYNLRQGTKLAPSNSLQNLPLAL
jgi:hypothetical protein